MIFFRVTQSINIKTTDGTLVKYNRLKGPSNLNNETVYITTSSDFEDLKQVFKNVDEVKFKARLLKESRVRAAQSFPTELGILNENEYLNSQEFKEKSKEFFINTQNESALLINEEKQDLYKQVKKIDSNSVSIVIIGSLGKSISQMVASCTALRILHNKLKEIYKNVFMDIYIEASNNSFYSRDKSIYKKQSFIRSVFPLSITSQKLCEYDYFIDTSSFDLESLYFKDLNYVDAWLYKFGIDYLKVPKEQKYNSLDFSKISIDEKLTDKLNKIKSKGKVLLYHPYSANVKKSIPQAYAVDILKKLIKKMDDYTIISTIKIDAKFKDDRYIDLTKESGSFNEFAYIVSCCDAIVSCDTSTFHIADAFMIPTVAIFTNNESQKYTKYYPYVKTIEVADESKSFSKFIFENEELTFYKFSSWEKFKTSKIIKLLETF